MAIDLKQLESSIEELEIRKRKLEKLRTLLSDEDTRELISDPEILSLIKGTGSVNHTNGVASKSAQAVEERDDEPAEGTLRRAVLDVARQCPDKFESKYVLRKLREANYAFGAKQPEVSIHGALIYLSDRKKNLVRLVRRGKGRQPSIYEAVRKEGTK
jgi:hypothetical protein